MNLFSVMDVSGSALKAERVRAEVVASNMANAETTRTADGTPYRRQHVVFESIARPSFGDVLQNGMKLSGPISTGTSSTSGAKRSGPLSDGMSSPVGDVAGGVKISGVVSDSAAALRRFEPGHPDADKDGYVAYPDINPLTEMVDLMGATRAYGANASALTAEKNMVNASLDILKG